MKVFNFIEIEPKLYVEKRYLKLFKESSFLSKISSWDNLGNFYEVTFSHKKAYREIKALRIADLEIYLKKYSKNLSEARKEWENINLLWDKGFPTSLPILFYQTHSFAIIGTAKLRGRSFVDLLPKENLIVYNLIKKIAKFLADFHKENLIHQDCYLNHFYFGEELDQLYIIDVSRVKYKPFLFCYYQIKDLSQLRFSFYKYLGKDWLNLWELFLKTYEKELGKSLNFFKKNLLLIKFKRIEKHTKKLEKIS